MVEAGVRFWRSSSTLTSNKGLSSSEAELRSMRNNGQTKLMNRFWNWSKIFNDKELVLELCQLLARAKQIYISYVRL